jgi:hypothetical protein
MKDGNAWSNPIRIKGETGTSVTVVYDYLSYEALS